jgi:hypothetical protein
LTVTARGLAAWRSAVDPTANELSTWAPVVLASQAGAAHFAVGTAPAGTRVASRLSDETGDELLSWNARPGLPFLDAGTWWDVLSLAMVCRDRDRTEALCAIEPDRLGSPDIATPAFLTTWVRTWQALWRGDADQTAALLIQSHDEMTAAQMPANQREYLDLILAPQLTRHLQRDPALFGTVLAVAVEDHKAYWSTPERADDPDRFIAWAPLAIASLARENDCALTVELPYLPTNLLNGSWVGELPTRPTGGTVTTSLDRRRPGPGRGRAGAGPGSGESRGRAEPLRSPSNPMSRRRG